MSGYRNCIHGVLQTGVITPKFDGFVNLHLVHQRVFGTFSIRITLDRHRIIHKSIQWEQEQKSRYIWLEKTVINQPYTHTRKNPRDSYLIDFCCCDSASSSPPFAVVNSTHSGFPFLWIKKEERRSKECAAACRQETRWGAAVRQNDLRQTNGLPSEGKKTMKNREE